MKKLFLIASIVLTSQVFVYAGKKTTSDDPIRAAISDTLEYLKKDNPSDEETDNTMKSLACLPNNNSLLLLSQLCGAPGTELLLDKLLNNPFYNPSESAILFALKDTRKIALSGIPNDSALDIASSLPVPQVITDPARQSAYRCMMRLLFCMRLMPK
jgi:hypothetical protein